MFVPAVRCTDITTVSPATKVFGETEMVHVVALLPLTEQLPIDVEPFLTSV